MSAPTVRAEATEQPARVGTLDMSDADWLSSIVAQMTPRPCVVEYVPESSSTDFLSFARNRNPAQWRIVIRGVDMVPFIDPARITLRDEEHVKRRVAQFLPEAERPASP